MVPSQIIAVLGSPAFSQKRLASLEMLQTVGAPLHLEYKQRLLEALPGRFFELYRPTEGFVTILHKTAPPPQPASVGLPPPLFAMLIPQPVHHDLTPCL